MFHIVLVEPEIPQNTGNISRTCAVTGCALHLVHPLGFSIDDKHLKRAGLDYWKDLQLFEYETIFRRSFSGRKFPCVWKGNRRSRSGNPWKETGRRRTDPDAAESALSESVQFGGDRRL